MRVTCARDHTCARVGGVRQESASPDETSMGCYRAPSGVGRLYYEINFPFSISALRIIPLVVGGLLGGIASPSTPCPVSSVPSPVPTSLKL